MTTHIPAPGPYARAQETSPAAEEAQVRGCPEPRTRHSARDQQSMTGRDADSLEVSARGDQCLRSSPDPMSATDRYRLVTPYRLRL